MKKYFIFLIFIYSTSLAQKNKIVSISGYAYNFNNAAIIEDKSEFEEILLEKENRRFIPDSNSFFQIEFHLNFPKYFRIGRNIVFLSPGDNIEISIDYKDPTKAIFKGDHSVENEYLKNTPYPKMGSFLNGEDGIRVTISETIQFISNQYNEKNIALNKIKDRINKDFFKLESSRCKADFINSLLNIFTYYSWVNKTPKDSLDYLKKHIDSLSIPIINKISSNLLQSENLQLSVYRDVLGVILKGQTGNAKIPSKIADWIKCRDIKMKAVSLENKKQIKELKTLSRGINSVIYRTAINNTIDDLSKLNIGDRAKDFSLTDKYGKKIQLSSFGNKIIYIDLWATWCGPCIENRPFLDSLIFSLKENEDIVVLSISIDEDVNRWKQYLSKGDLYKYEYIIDQSNLQDYNITFVPRSVLIDKQFNIVHLYASAPNSKSLKPELIRLSYNIEMK